jgi:hypothetical protein
MALNASAFLKARPRTKRDKVQISATAADIIRIIACVCRLAGDTVGDLISMNSRTAHAAKTNLGHFIIGL